MGRLQRAAARLYRASLLLYPAPFRRAWGQQLAETFRDGSRDAARRGPAALARFWGRVAVDSVRSAAAERWARRREGGVMGRNGAIFAALTALGAAAFGWLCLHTDETGRLAGSLMILAFALAFARPRQTWAAALLGLVAPTAQALAHLAGWRVPYPNDWPQVAGAGIAVVFSIVAACAGALCGWTFSRLRHAPR